MSWGRTGSAPVLGACTLGAWLLLLAPVATATTFGITSGGIDVAAGCTAVSCGATQTFELATALAPATGTVDLDTGALTLGFSLSVGTVELDRIGGGEDNGVASVVFSPVTYATTAPLSLIDAGFGNYVIAGGQTAAVSGMQTQQDDLAGSVNGTPAAFAAATAGVTGSCTVTTATTITCGLTFGSANFTLEVGDPPDLDPETRWFRHTANIGAVVPEPAPGALLALGLTGLAAGRRRR